MTLYTGLFHLHTERVGETICRHNFPPKTSQISRALARRSRMLTQRSRPIAGKAKTDLFAESFRASFDDYLYSLISCETRNT